MNLLLSLTSTLPLSIPSYLSLFPPRSLFHHRFAPLSLFLRPPVPSSSPVSPLSPLHNTRPHELHALQHSQTVQPQHTTAQPHTPGIVTESAVVFPEQSRQRSVSLTSASFLVVSVHVNLISQETSPWSGVHINRTPRSFRARTNRCGRKDTKDIFLSFSVVCGIKYSCVSLCVCVLPAGGLHAHLRPVFLLGCVGVGGGCTHTSVHLRSKKMEKITQKTSRFKDLFLSSIWGEGLTGNSHPASSSCLCAEVWVCGTHVILFDVDSTNVDTGLSIKSCTQKQKSNP